KQLSGLAMFPMTSVSAVRTLFAGVFAAVCGFDAGPASAQDCGNGSGGFPAWLERYKSRAGKLGVSPATVSRGLAGLSYDANVIRLDRSQRSFKLSFEQFYRRRVSNSLLNKGRRLLRTHSGTLSRVEGRYGVPGEVIIAIWGLETAYGRDGTGGKDIIRSLATLAYDCRRSAFFTNELTYALKILQRGDLSRSHMRGGWAGEIGQVQFLPSSYFKYAVDFDGDGRRDLTRSVPDMLASTANFLRAHGWKRGQSYGPGTANYAVIREWNRAEVYQRTISRAAELIGGR
ncbi:MAG: lytic transglycosylase domain-containing protein, partial [Hyphomicrobiaceae bacterium]